MFRSNHNALRALVALLPMLLIGCATPLTFNRPPPYPKDEMPRYIQMYRQGALEGDARKQVVWSEYLSEGWTEDHKPDFAESHRFLMMALEQDSISAHAVYGKRLAFGRIGEAKNEIAARKEIDRAYELWENSPKKNKVDAYFLSEGIVNRGLLLFYGPHDNNGAFLDYCLALDIDPASPIAPKNMRVIGKSPSQCPK